MVKSIKSIQWIKNLINIDYAQLFFFLSIFHRLPIKSTDFYRFYRILSIIDFIDWSGRVPNLMYNSSGTKNNRYEKDILNWLNTSCSYEYSFDRFINQKS